jgi:hypothetical protein
MVKWERNKNSFWHEVHVRHSILGKLFVVAGIGIIVFALIDWSKKNRSDGLAIIPPTSLIQAVEIETEFIAPLSVENTSSAPVRMVGMSWC